MTDDDREGFEPKAAPDDAGDPAAAFEALRRTVEKQGGQLNAEMTIIRKGVELALEQSEKVRKQPDYGPDLGKIIQFLAIVEERLAGVEQSPILRNGPEHYARALERSGEGLVRTAALALENESRDFQRVARELVEHVAGARERDVQNRLLGIIGAAGVLAGIVLTLFIPNMLPGQFDTRVAGFIMGQDRWNAGVTMMRVADPEGWRGVVDSSQLVRDNAEAIGQCSEAARTAGEVQICTIVVKAPAL